MRRWLRTLSAEQCRGVPSRCSCAPLPSWPWCELDSSPASVSFLLLAHTHLRPLAYKAKRFVWVQGWGHFSPWAKPLCHGQNMKIKEEEGAGTHCPLQVRSQRPEDLPRGPTTSSHPHMPSNDCNSGHLRAFWMQRIGSPLVT